MAQIYKFFNSTSNDVRSYQASDFASYFGDVLKTGLIHTDGVPDLDVMCDGNDLRTYVKPGKAIVQGYAYENTDDLYLEHGLPEATLDRIDRIVLRLDKRNQSRFIKLFIIQGEPNSNPVAPSIQRDEFIFELSLAQIRVRANTSSLNPADLMDERFNEDLCGLVSVQNMGFAPLNEFNDLKNSYDSRTNDYVPSGAIIMWSGTHSAIPSGWRLCNGLNGTPDLRDRFILGATNESDIGETGGQHEVTLTTNQIPSHSHSGSTNYGGSHTHSGDYFRNDNGSATIGGSSGGSVNRNGSVSSGGSHTHTFTTNTTGGGQSHENRPAFYKLAFIMKA